jgi:hemerythrin-like domain-containing protein
LQKILNTWPISSLLVNFLAENIFDKIEEEHEEFKEMLSEMEDSKKGNTDTFEEFKKELNAHIKAEEQTLYESMNTDKKGKEMVLVGIEEHRMGTNVLHKLEKATGEDWNVQLMVLKHLLEKHIEVEEEEVIPMAKKMLNKTKVNEISEQFESIEEKLE